MTPTTKDRIASGLTIAIALAGVYAAFVRIDVWAASSFARKILAAELVAVIDVGVVLVALCCAPGISSLVRKLLR
jgi:hypothetical protein